MSEGAIVATVTVSASAIMLAVAVLVAPPTDPTILVEHSPVASCRMLTGDIQSWAPQDSTMVYYICPEEGKGK
jgi:hypothetical protein